MPRTRQLTYLLEHPLAFAGRVWRGFRANQGFLLAGEVAIILLLGAQAIAEYERLGTAQPRDHGLQTADDAKPPGAG